MLRYLYSLKVIATTLFLFVFLWGISNISLPDALNPIQEALDDFKSTDVIFSKFTDYDQKRDTNIVVVNIGKSGRGTIAQMLQNVQRFRPKVVGIDALFRQLETDRIASGATREDSLQARYTDSLLAASFKQYNNVVLVSELSGYDSIAQRFDTVLTSHPFYNRYVQTGFANITNDENSKKTIRSVSPVQQLTSGRTEYSFAIQIMRQFRPEAAEYCLARENNQELVNWFGGINNFFFIEGEDILDTNADYSFLQDKIVLMAYVEVNEHERDLEDMYFTPMNPEYAGKAYPDIHGIYVHANFLSMMLRKDYIKNMPGWLGLVVAIMGTHLFLALFAWIHYKYPSWFDISIRLTQLFITLVVMLPLSLWVFFKFRYQLDINLLTLGIVIGPDVLEIILPFWDKSLEYPTTRLVRRLFPTKQ